jgi:hypothetical protein
VSRTVVSGGGVLAVINRDRILGGPDRVLQPWFIRRAAELASSVGRVSIAGKAFGTGFLISPRLVLTACHVLPNVRTAETSSLELDYQREQDGSFRRVMAVRLSPSKQFACDTARDFAIVGLEEEMKGRACISLVDDGNTTFGEKVSLFQHPQGGPLTISLLEGSIVAVSDEVVHHDASTFPGSAGAPLLDESLRLIGLHHASRLRATSAEGPVNEAVRASAILAFLADRHPALMSELSDSRQFKESSASAEPCAIGLDSASDSAVTLEIVEPSTMPNRDSIFVSYARGDQGKRRWRERLRTFLLPLVADLDIWDDSRIETGADWRTEINIALRRPRVAVLLVGPSFLASEFIAQEELPILLSAAAEEGVPVLPLITNHCSYERTELRKYQSFNDPRTPLEAMQLHDQNRWLQRFAERIAEAYHRSAACSG